MIQGDEDVDFNLPEDLNEYLAELDDFIEAEIKPLEQRRRQHPLLRPPPGGRPDRLGSRRAAQPRVGVADGRGPAPGRRRRPSTGTRCPKEYGGQEGSNLGMAIIREHLAAQGPGPALRPADRAHHRRQQPGLAAHGKIRHRQQKAEWLPKMAEMRGGFAFGITELNHGTDATYMETEGLSGRG